MSLLELPVSQPGPRAPRAAQSPPWRLIDRVGLAVAWLLGLLFCALAGALVLYFLVQGIKYVRPSLFLTNPSPGFTATATGGFLDPMLGDDARERNRDGDRSADRDRGRRVAERVRPPRRARHGV